MVKCLTKHGNSYALVIDRPVLDLLNIDEKTPLEISTDGQSLVISPVREDEAEFETALAEVHRRYGRALKKLAE